MQSRSDREANCLLDDAIPPRVEGHRQQTQPYEHQGGGHQGTNQLAHGAVAPDEVSSLFSS